MAEKYVHRRVEFTRLAAVLNEFGCHGSCTCFTSISTTYVSNYHTNINDISAAHVVVFVASSKHVKCRSLNLSLDHPKIGAINTQGRSVG